MRSQTEWFLHYYYQDYKAAGHLISQVIEKLLKNPPQYHQIIEIHGEQLPQFITVENRKHLLSSSFFVWEIHLKLLKVNLAIHKPYLLVPQRLSSLDKASSNLLKRRRNKYKTHDLNAIIGDEKSSRNNHSLSMMLLNVSCKRKMVQDTCSIHKISRKMRNVVVKVSVYVLYSIFLWI